MDKNNDLGMMNGGNSASGGTLGGVNGEPNGGYFPTSPSPTSFCSPQTYANYQNQLNNNQSSEREKLMNTNLENRAYSPSPFGPRDVELLEKNLSLVLKSILQITCARRQGMYAKITG